MYISEEALHQTAQLVGYALIVVIILICLPESWLTWPKRKKK